MRGRRRGWPRRGSELVLVMRRMGAVSCFAKRLLMTKMAVETYSLCFIGAPRYCGPSCEDASQMLILNPNFHSVSTLLVFRLDLTRVSRIRRRCFCPATSMGLIKPCISSCQMSEGSEFLEAQRASIRLTSPQILKSQNSTPADTVVPRLPRRVPKRSHRCLARFSIQNDFLSLA